VPVAAALNEAGADDGPEGGRTSRHSDEAPPGPVCEGDVDGVGAAGAAAGAGGVTVSLDDAAVPAAAAPRDVAVDVAVKVGRRSPGAKTEGPGAAEPELDGGGAMIEPPGTAGAACFGAVAASSESEAPLFPDGLNQLVVAAIACLTA
jgi:hypothetical protein